MCACDRVEVVSIYGMCSYIINVLCIPFIVTGKHRFSASGIFVQHSYVNPVSIRSNYTCSRIRDVRIQSLTGLDI